MWRYPDDSMITLEMIKTNYGCYCTSMHFSHDLQECAIGMLNARMSVRAITRAPNFNASTMSHLRCRLEEIGTTANRPHAWRPRVTTLAQDRYIRIFHLRDHLRPAGLTADVLHCPKSTVGCQSLCTSPSRWIGLHPHSMRRATRLGQEAHLLDVSMMEAYPCPLQWRGKFPASQSIWVAACVEPCKGSECWSHCCKQSGKQRQRYNGLGGIIPRPSHSNPCHC